MSHVHLANVPRHVGRRPRNLEALVQAPPVNPVHVIHPDRHPHGTFRGLIRAGAERRTQRAPAASALPVLAEEDLTGTGADTPKARRRAPVPGLLPPELLEPGEALLYVRDVENGRQAAGAHGVAFQEALRSEGFTAAGSRRSDPLRRGESMMQELARLAIRSSPKSEQGWRGRRDSNPRPP